MKGFRSLFKVRKPGNGDSVQKALLSPKKGPSIASKKGIPNGGGKKPC